jgi:hypothetical protein
VSKKQKLQYKERKSFATHPFNLPYAAKHMLMPGSKTTPTTIKKYSNTLVRM